MARLLENPETLARIKEKAMRNAKERNTYGTKAEFRFGLNVLNVEERHEIYRHLGVPLDATV
jgi:hypothetical protein